jgi:hypothetical protein
VGNLTILQDLGQLGMEVSDAVKQQPWLLYANNGDGSLETAANQGEINSRVKKE